MRTSWINPDAEYEAALERFVVESLENPLFWGESALCLPEGIGELEDVVTGRHHRPDGGRMRVTEILATFPVALMVAI